MILGIQQHSIEWHGPKIVNPAKIITSLMNHYIEEINKLNLNVRWLEPEKAKNSYQYALNFSSTQYYGLNPETVRDIEKLERYSDSVAKEWVKERLSSSNTVQVVSSDQLVFVIPADQFLENWQDMFLPVRDDAIILHNTNKTVMF